jgi:hypothetical protein
MRMVLIIEADETRILTKLKKSGEGAIEHSCVSHVTTGIHHQGQG